MNEQWVSDQWAREQYVSEQWASEKAVREPLVGGGGGIHAHISPLSYQACITAYTVAGLLYLKMFLHFCG